MLGVGFSVDVDEVEVLGIFLERGVKVEDVVLEGGEELLQVLVIDERIVVLFHQGVLELVHVLSARNESVAGGHVTQIFEFHLFNELY